MSQPTHHLYEFGQFRLDAMKRLLLREGEVVPLTPKAFETLLALVECHGQVLEKETLIKRLWPDSFVEEGNLTFNISTLRKALGESPQEHQYIVTIPGRGYRFVADVREVQDGSADLVSKPELTEGEVERRKQHRSLFLSVSPSLARRRLLALVGMAGLLALLLGLNVGGWRERLLGRSAVRIQSLAVLPLANLSGDPEQDYFADGMTEELITELSKIGAWRVRSRPSVMRYKGVNKPLPEIARELQVDAVVAGSALRSGERVRVTAQLIHAATDRNLWAESFERDLSNLLSLQREVARAIAHEVKIKLTSQEQTRLATARPVNPEAQEAYLKGRYYLHQAMERSVTKGKEDLPGKTVASFEQAINVDPDYAQAYAGLATARYLFAKIGAREPYTEAKAVAMRAIELDDMLAEAHLTLAAVFLQELDWTGAEREFKRAIALDPNSSECHHRYVFYLGLTGRLDEAMAEIELAQELDPTSLLPKTNAGIAYIFARQYDRAVAQFQKTLELSPTYSPALLGLGWAYVHQGKYEEAIAALKKAADLSGNNSAILERLAWAYAVSGQRAEAIKLLETLKGRAEQQRLPAAVGGMAIIYAALGDRDQAFAWLERDFEARNLRVASLKVDPAYDGLRSDPRYAKLLQRLGLAP